MSELDEYPRINTKLFPEEWNRKGADAINYLLSKTGNIDDILLRILRVYEEKMIATGPTTVTLGTFTDWTSSEAPEESTILFNTTTGVATIGADGWYRVSAYISWTGGSNNQWYGIDLQIDTTDILVGSTTTSNNTSLPQAVNGSFQGFLAAGTTLSLEWNVNSADIVQVPDRGQLSIEMMGTDLV